MVLKCEGERHLTIGIVLVRAGYAIAGALVAVLVSWIVSWAPWPAVYALLARGVGVGAALMLWASFKPSRGSSVSTVCEALLVVAALVVAEMAGDLLTNAAPGSSLWDVDLIESTVLFLLISGVLSIALVSWLLGSSARWARRSLLWVLGELGFGVAAMLLWQALFPLFSGLGEAILSASVFIAVAGLAGAAVIQRLVNEIVRRVRGGDGPAPEPPPRHRRAAHAEPIGMKIERIRAKCVQPVLSAGYRKLRIAVLVMLAVLAVAGMLALAFFLGKQAGVLSERGLPEKQGPSVPSTNEASALPAQDGYSYHTRGIVVALDPDANAFLLEVGDSTEDIAKGAHVMALCTYAETSPLEFAKLAVGTQVALRSVQAHAGDGSITVQRYEIGEERVEIDEVPLAKPASSAEIEQVFASCGCGFRVVGTVVSPVAADGSFDLRVDGGAPLAAGVTIRVAVDGLKQTVGNASALVEGASGITVGFSYWPDGSEVHAKALVIGGG